MEVYNKNRDKNQNIHDEIREQNAKLKDLSFKEKLQYFKDYYLKITLAVIACAVILGLLIHDMVSGPEDTVFAAYFFNDSGDSGDTTLQDNFASYMNIDTKEHDVYIDATMFYYNEEELAQYTGVSTYEIYTNLQKTMAMVSAKDLDIIAGTESVIKYFAQSDCFIDINELLTPEQLEKYQDYIYYYTNTETGVTSAVGINISEAPKIKEFHYYDYSAGIMGFVINSEDLDNAVAFLDYIFME